MAQPGFWDNGDSAQAIVAQLSSLKAVIEPVERATTKTNDMLELFQLANEEQDIQTLESIAEDLKSLQDYQERGGWILQILS